MGEYRTFSNKVVYLSGLDGSTNSNTVWHGNVLQEGTAKQENLPDLPVRGKNAWQKRSPATSFSKSRLTLTNLLIIGSLLLQPCTSYSTENRAERGISRKHTLSSGVGARDDARLTNDNLLILGETDSQDIISHATVASSPNCTRPSSEEFPTDLFTKDQRQNGAIVLHFLICFYMLYALLLVCDEYFVPSIECICEELRVPHNIAGATFMAISTSAPELFTNVIGTFVTKGDLGVGTIVGSAVFNVLAVGSCIGIGTHVAVVQRSSVGSLRGSTNKRTNRKGVPLDWWSLTRDSGFYLLSVCALIAVLLDGRVYWHESLVLLALYGLYILGMCYDAQCKAFFETLTTKIAKTCLCDCNTQRKLSIVVRKVVEETNDESAPLIPKNGSRNSYVSEPPCNEEHSDSVANIPSQTKNSRKVSLVEVLCPHAGSLDNSSSTLSSESNCSKDSTSSSTIMLLDGFKDVISFPIRFALSWTIPDSRNPKRRNLYAISLICCVAWIGGISYMISWMVCIIGETLAIPDSVSGLTFLAAGTSLPEVVSSVIVARQGFGSMGLSNSIGSNTFDILVCLGLPWLIECLILASKDINYIEIHSGGLAFSAILLVSSLIFVYIIIAVNNYVLDMKIGITCVFTYLIFITLACLFEMNVFFPVNLPTC